MFLIICFSTVIVVGTVVESTFTVPKNFIYKPMSNLDEAKLFGKWYHFARISNNFEPSNACSRTNLKLNKNGTVSSTVSSLNTITGFRNFWGGLLLAPKDNESLADGMIQFPDGATYSKHKFAVLGCDYIHFCSVIMLQDVGLSTKYVLNAWIVSRDRTLEFKFYKHAIEAFRKNCIPIHAFEKVNQHNCRE